MPLENEALVLDLVEWIAARPRRYDDVISAWRTSCPRLPIWEDALDHGLVVREHRPKEGAMVVATDKGRAFLDTAGRVSQLPQKAGIAATL